MYVLRLGAFVVVVGCFLRIPEEKQTSLSGSSALPRQAGRLRPEVFSYSSFKTVRNIYQSSQMKVPMEEFPVNAFSLKTSSHLHTSSCDTLCCLCFTA